MIGEMTPDCQFRNAEVFSGIFHCFLRKIVLKIIVKR